MNRRTLILASLTLAVSLLADLAEAETTMTQDERKLLLTCAAAILSLDGVLSELSKEDRADLCRLADVQEHEKIGPVLMGRLRKVA